MCNLKGHILFGQDWYEYHIPESCVSKASMASVTEKSSASLDAFSLCNMADIMS